MMKNCFAEKTKSIILQKSRVPWHPWHPSVDGPELHKHEAKRCTGADASLQFMKTHRFSLI